ncbi:hypothetical protein DV451_001475 [Geotrichum candidum]|uniref:DNA polymerase alpha subunit B n=1 Tax=Geotrichum candidum TaxID=1173061 RepID=A0A9P5G8Z3_GEOCN|nr:hypothetical protein DV451_001475 [Geotrichum candidum]
MTSSLAFLEQKFGTSVVNQPDVLAEIHSILRLFKITVEEFYNKWEVFDMNSIPLETNNKQDVFSIERLKEFRGTIQKELEQDMSAKAKRKSLVQTPVRAVRKTFGSSPGTDFLDNLLGGSSPGVNSPNLKKRAASTINNGSGAGNLKTPSKYIKSNLASSPGVFLPSSPVTDLPQSTNYSQTLNKTGGNTASTTYTNRSGKGTVLQVLNNHIPARASDKTESEPATKFSLNVDLKKYTYRTLYQKISEVAEYLDDRIESFIPEILEYNKLSEDQLGNPALSLQHEIVAIGRIVPESPADERLNKNSIALESCRRVGAGMRVRLKFPEEMSFHFFPGQIAGFKGSNAGGDYFAVSEILDIPLLPPAARNPDQEEKNLQVLTAAGPYTLDVDGLDFSPLDDLITQISVTKPDVVILLGPFIDVTNKAVVQGKFQVHNPATGEIDANATLDDLFKSTVSARLKKLDFTNLSVILVPHVRDTAAGHTAFPQAPFNRRELDLPREVKCVSNPATFTINGTVFSVSSQDILHDLTKVTTKHLVTKSFFSTCMEDILSQRTVYPLYPGSVKVKTDDASNEETIVASAGLDVPFMGLAEFQQALPDVLIIPSILKATTQVISSVVTINPGFLVKPGGNGGQFAKIDIVPRDEKQDQPEIKKENENEDDEVNEVYKRARVEIIKI